MIDVSLATNGIIHSATPHDEANAFVSLNQYGELVDATFDTIDQTLDRFSTFPTNTFMSMQSPLNGNGLPVSDRDVISELSRMAFFKRNVGPMTINFREDGQAHHSNMEFEYRGDSGSYISVWGIDNAIYNQSYRNNLDDYRWDLAGQIGLTINARAGNLGLFALSHDLPNADTRQLSDGSPILGNQLSYSGWLDSGAWYQAIEDGKIAGFNNLAAPFSTNTVEDDRGTGDDSDNIFYPVHVTSIEQEWSDMFAGWALDGFTDVGSGLARQEFMTEWVPRLTNTSYMRGELGWEVLVVPVEVNSTIDTTTFTQNFQISNADIYNANSFGNGNSTWNQNGPNNLSPSSNDFLLVPINQPALVQQIGAGLGFGISADFGTYQESLSYRVDVRYNMNTGEVGFFLVVDHNSVLDIDPHIGPGLDVTVGLLGANDTWGMNPGAISYSTNVISSAEALYFGGSYYKIIGSDTQEGLQMADEAAEGLFVDIGSPNLGVNAGLNTEAVIYLGGNLEEIISNFPQIINSTVDASATLLGEQPVLTTVEGSTGNTTIDPVDFSLNTPITYNVHSNGLVTVNYETNYAPSQDVLASAGAFFNGSVEIPPDSLIITQPIIINSDGTAMGFIDYEGNLVNFDYPNSPYGPILPGNTQIVPGGRSLLTPDGILLVQQTDGSIVEVPVAASIR